MRFVNAATSLACLASMANAAIILAHQTSGTAVWELWPTGVEVLPMTVRVDKKEMGDWIGGEVMIGGLPADLLAYSTSLDGETSIIELVGSGSGTIVNPYSVVLSVSMDREVETGTFSYTVDGPITYYAENINVYQFYTTSTSEWDQTYTETTVSIYPEDQLSTGLVMVYIPRTTDDDDDPPSTTTTTTTTWTNDYSSTTTTTDDDTVTVIVQVPEPSSEVEDPSTTTTTTTTTTWTNDYSSTTTTADDGTVTIIVQVPELTDDDDDDSSSTTTTTTTWTNIYSSTTTTTDGDTVTIIVQVPEPTDDDGPSSTTTTTTTWTNIYTSTTTTTDDDTVTIIVQVPEETDDDDDDDDISSTTTTTTTWTNTYSSTTTTTDDDTVTIIVQVPSASQPPQPWNLTRTVTKWRTTTYTTWEYCTLDYCVVTTVTTTVPDEPDSTVTDVKPPTSYITKTVTDCRSNVCTERTLTVIPNPTTTLTSSSTGTTSSPSSVTPVGSGNTMTYAVLPIMFACIMMML